MKTPETTTLDSSPSASLFYESWIFFKKDKMAYSSFLFLIGLGIFAVLGKAATAWISAFDPSAVRLADKFMAPAFDNVVDKGDPQETRRRCLESIG